MNKVMLLGRLARDPELRYTSTEQPMAVAKITLAVEQYSSKKQEKSTDFISCTAFGKTAEALANHVSKGRMITAEGRLKTGSYDKEGQKIYTTEIIIDKFYFCDYKRSKKDNTTADVDAFFEAQEDEDCPF